MVLIFLNFFFTVRSWSFTGTEYAPKTCEIDAKSPTIVFAVVDLPKEGALAFAAFPANP